MVSQTSRSYRRSTGSAALCIATLLVLSACGSTSPWADRIQTDDTQHGSLESPYSNDPSEISDSKLKSGNADSTKKGTDGSIKQSEQHTMRDSSGIARDQTLRGTRLPTTPPTSPASGPGFTANTINLGYATMKQADVAYSSAGYDTSFGDQEAIARAIANTINRQGGVANRRVNLVFHDIDVATFSTNPNRAAQEACATWTQDHRVFAAITVIPLAGSQSNALYPCLAKHRIPLIDASAGFAIPGSFFTNYSPYLYATQSTSIEQQAKIWIHRLMKQGYFQAWDHQRGVPGSMPVNVGLIARQFGKQYVDITRNELRRFGIDVAASHVFSEEASAAGQEGSSVVLRFRQEDVTHVLLFSGASWFMDPATSQQYKPRYGVTTSTFPRLLRNTDNALNGAHGIGWLPAKDVTSHHDPGTLGKADRNCREIMTTAGQSTDNRDAWALMASACDSFNVLKKSVELGGLSPEGIQYGIGAIRRMPSAGMFKMSFSNNRPYGPGAARDLEMLRNCNGQSSGCFTYTNRTNHAM